MKAARETARLTTYLQLAEVAGQDKSAFAGGNLVARWEHKMGRGSSVQIQTYFDRTNRDSIELGETRNTFDVDYIQHARTYQKAGVDMGPWSKNKPRYVIQSSPSVNVLPNKHTDTIYSSFVQYEVPFDNDRFTITAGSKFERTSFSGYDYQPSVRLLWSPTAHQSAWLATTRAVRTPSRVDQDVQFNIWCKPLLHLRSSSKLWATPI